MNLSAHWIWVDDDLDYKKKACHFKRDFVADVLPENYQVFVSADSLYQLFVNGQFVSRGPCKGDDYRQYFDRVDLAPYMRVGTNVIVASVIRFPNESLSNLSFKTGTISVVSSSRGGFLLAEERNLDLNLGLSTDDKWKAMPNNAISFREAEHAKYVGDMEDVDGNEFPYRWELNAADIGIWKNAKTICTADSSLKGGLLNQWQLTERDIPFLYEKDIGFARVMKSSNERIPWMDLIEGKEVNIPAGGHEWAELDVGELTTARLKLLMTGSQNSKIKMTYAESYVAEFDNSGNLYKGIRDDAKGWLQGEFDRYLLREGTQFYEPFSYRTFRFLRLDIEATDQSLTIKRLQLTETGYPLEIKGSWKSGHSKWQKLWDISVRTLQRCMHDTYIDSPYYERMQYSMDTMLQMLFTYRLSTDDRLARKAILDFHSSVMPNGMMACNWPAKFKQVIPGFSIYWIIMLRDHYEYFGDLELVSKYLPTVERVLNYFIAKIDSRTELISDIGYWQFVDWVEEWTDSFGSPLQENESINVIYNLMVVYGLRTAAQLNRYANREDVAAEFETRAVLLSRAINSSAWSPVEGMYKDTPNREDFSQHAQVWAVLGDVLVGDAAKSAMLKSLNEKKVAKCSYSMSFFLFRALEKVGLYSHTNSLWDNWIQLLDKNVTTWPEDPVTQRSDCHAWGAIPIYEFSACILGVKPLQPGYEEILIEPHAEYFRQAEGTVSTRWGPVYVKWERDDHRFGLRVRLPEPRKTVVVMPNGERQVFAGRTEFSLEQGTRVAYANGGGEGMD
ncbi:alpha-L-rhamnosidase C-terminal domain-containing protein [Paenibacillus agaridevorans]|uniref:alpha-L-rhamnosidase-related protein n=1 Tax=Paenibacillus agaridevorans TaxID=171404 RepID=UPI001BE4177A|nr:alpha-L-rhamnosidase C-terminal domain-containing protein [Paenibacillus agaridevorans]